MNTACSYRRNRPSNCHFLSLHQYTVLTNDQIRFKFMKIFVRILDATPYKTIAIRPLGFHLVNHSRRLSIGCWILLDMSRETDKRYSPIDFLHMNVLVSVSGPAKTYIHYLCVDTRYHLEDLLRVMNDKIDVFRKNVKGLPSRLGL